MQNLSYDSPYNDDDFGFRSIENNSRVFTPDDQHRGRRVDCKTIDKQQHHSSNLEQHPKEITKKKK